MRQRTDNNAGFMQGRAASGCCSIGKQNIKKKQMPSHPWFCVHWCARAVTRVCVSIPQHGAQSSAPLLLREAALNTCRERWAGRSSGSVRCGDRHNVKCNHKHKAKGRGGGKVGGVEPKELKLQQRGSETPADNLQILQEGSFRCRSHTLLTHLEMAVMLSAPAAAAERDRAASRGRSCEPSHQAGATIWLEVNICFALRRQSATHGERGQRPKGLQIKPDVQSVSYLLDFKFLPCYATLGHPRPVLAPSQSSISNGAHLEHPSTKTSLFPFK